MTEQRKYCGHVTAHPLELPELGGAWEVTFTDANHAYVGSPSGWAGTDRGIITIRGVEYGGSVHMHRWADGEWHIGPEDYPEWHDFRQVHLSRADGNWKKGASASAKAKAGEVITARFREYVAEHGAIVAHAERNNVSDKIRTLDSDIAKLREQMQELESKRAALLEQESQS